MELRGYLEVLERRKWIVLATTFVAVALVFFGTVTRTPGYSSSALVRVSESGDSPVGYNEFNYSERLISTYVQLMQGRGYLADVISQLGLNLSPEELKNMVRVEQVAKTELIRVTVDSPSADQSAEIANAMASLLASRYQQGGQVTSVVETAAPPRLPTGGPAALYILLSTLVGLMGGIGLAYLMEKLDPAIHSMEELEEAVALPVVGAVPTIPRLDGGWGSSLLKEGAERTPVGEAFRLLATGTHAALGEDAPWDVKSHRALLITSAAPRSGKSMVAVNLAATVARTGQQVILVDANLKNPSLNGYFGTTGKVGLAEVLSNPARLESALQPGGVPGLRVLPAGVSSPSSGELLNSSRMQQLIQRLLGEAHLVLIDSPAVLVSADAAVIGSMVDGALLVTTRDETTGGQVEQAVRQLERAGGRALGAIFNKAKGGMRSREYSAPHSRVDKSWQAGRKAARVEEGAEGLTVEAERLRRIM